VLLRYDRGFAAIILPRATRHAAHETATHHTLERLPENGKQKLQKQRNRTEVILFLLNAGDSRKVYFDK